MANSHATQAKNSLLKKLPAAYAQGLCASVRKFFAACQENIYSTVRNILCVQSETFCMYSQKHSVCTVRNIPTVLAERSPQIARISRLVTIFALLFCVCGATRAWGDGYEFFWNPNSNQPRIWSSGNVWYIQQYTSQGTNYVIDSQDYPNYDNKKNDYAFFGSRDGNTTVRLRNNYTYTANIGNAGTIYGIYFCFKNDDATGITINLAPVGNNSALTITNDFKFERDDGIQGEPTVKNININLNTTVTIGSSATPVNITIPSGVTLRIGSGRTTTINGNITIEKGGNLAVDGTLAINNGKITNNGTLTVNGTIRSTEKIANSTDSTVIFAGNSTINISDFATKYGNLTVSSSAARTITFSGETEIQSNMNLTGSDGKRITVQGMSNANIVINANSGKGEWLNIDYDTVSINGGTGATFDATQNCFDKTGAIVSGTQRGWKFPNLNDMYYWFGPGSTAGGTGNWRVPSNWRYGSVTGNIAADYPGAKPNAEVYIPSGTVTLGATPDNSLASVDITNGATLEISNSVTVTSDTITNDGIVTNKGTLTATNYTNNASGTLNLEAGSAFTVNAATGTWNNTGTVNVKDNAGVTLPNEATRVTEKGKWVYNNTTGNARELVIPYEANGTDTDVSNLTIANRFLYFELEIAAGKISVPYKTTGRNLTGVWGDGSLTVADNAELIIETSFLCHNLPSSGGGGLVYSTIRNSGKITINTNGIFRMAGNFTNGYNSSAGVVHLDGGTWEMEYSGSSYNNTASASVRVTSGSYNSGKATINENGLWIYDNTNNMSLFSHPYRNLQIGNGTSATTVTLTTDVTATGTITVSQNATLDLVGYNVSGTTTTITNNGTIRLHGTASQTVNGTKNNAPDSTVEFYDTGDADISKMGTTFYNLICTTGGKTLNFDQNISVNGNLTLNGTNGNLLSINGNNTNITLARANQSGSYLKINYANVSINSTGFTPYYSVGKTSTDGSGAMPMGNMRGWLFEVQDDYYWYGPSGGNWSEPANWRFSDSQSSPAPTSLFYPGNASSIPPTTGAKVHITPTAANTVTLNTTASVYSIEMNNNARLAIGANNLTVQNTWTNDGTVTVTSGNATLPAGTTDNGTWTYTVLRTGLVPITYNVLNLHGGTAGTIITPTATVTANSVNINADTILALGANNLSVQNTWTNDGTVTVTSGNATLPAGTTDNGTWTYTSSRTGLIRNITYKDVDIGDGTNSINVVLNSGLDSTGTLEIKNGCQLDLVNHSVSANNINNNGTVRLHGTQSVTGANNTGKPTFTGGNSGNVEFYGNTGTTPIDVSMMGTSYDNLTASGYNKTLEFTGTTTVAGDLILKGVNDNSPLTIASSGGAIINVAKSQGSTSTARGIYLAIDRANVEITGAQVPSSSPAFVYWADNSYDTDNTLPDALGAVRNGWRIPTIELTNMQLSVAPLGGNTVYVRAVQSTMDNLAKVAPKILTRLNLFFNVTNGSAGKIATVSSASLIYNGGKVAWIRLILSGLSNITVDNLKNYYVQTYVTNSGTISDEYHPLSDFAVGAVNPLFAYDNRYADSDANWQTSAFSSGVAVRNWDAGQGSDGSLLSKKDIVMSARLAGGSGNDMGNPVLYLSNNPTSGSQAGKYNGDTNSSWRVWLPDVTGVGELAGTPNGNAINNAITVSGSGTNPIFNIPAGSNSSYGNWKDGDQITFMFGVTDAATGNLIEVGGAEGSLAGVTKHPLYALRLREPGDITSLDLWSVRLRGMTAHRGGVSIRNNVINVTTGEQVTIEVDMPTTGTLNVMVMTLDGSIVKYLQHGTASEGKHAYHWGGLTNSGSPVARGLYFVRVVGSGIDETRKVMVVK